MLHHEERPATALAHGPAKPDDIERVRRDVENAVDASAEPRVDRELGEIEAACDTIREDVGRLKLAIAPEHHAAEAQPRRK